MCSRPTRSKKTAAVATHDDPPPGCAAEVIGRKEWRDHGALALHRSGWNFVIDTARPANFDRPWAPVPPRRARTDAVTDKSADGTTAAPSRAPPRDATPQQEDIEADQ
jgi:hypothetical protein